MVEEVDEDGEVVVFDPESIYADESLKVEKKEPQPEAVKEAKKSEEEILSELNVLFGDSSFASSILEMSQTGSPNQLLLPSPIEDKDQRTRCHLYFKATFPNRLVTDTVNGCFRVSLKTKSGGARPSAYDHRNNQSSTDPRPEPFLQFTLWKDGMDTMEAINFLCRKLGLLAKCFSYAGTKDRRAVSTQRCVVRNMFPARLAALNGIVNSRVKVSHLKRASGPLQFGCLSGNRFTIILRSLPETFSLEPVETAAKRLSQNGFINYYGLQRFGRGGGESSTDSIGRALLAGNFELACSLIIDPRPDESNEQIAMARLIWKTTQNPKLAFEAFPHRCQAERAILGHFIRQDACTDFRGAIASITRELRLMYVHAVQSRWWNAAASERIRRFGFESVVVGDLVLKTADSPIQIVTSENLHEFSIFDVVLPLIGRDSMKPTNEIGAFFDSSLAEIDLKLLHSEKTLFDLPGSYRSLLQRPINLGICELFHSDADEFITETSTGVLRALQLKFTLPTSAYATMLLREFFSRDYSTSGDFQKAL